MADVTITYNNVDIVELSDNSEIVLDTNGKRMTDDITITYNKSAPQMQSKTVNPSLSQQVITPDSGYDGLAAVTVAAISPIKYSQTYTPTTTDQVIQSGRWLYGNQTIRGDANLVAENIANGVTIFGVTGTLSGGNRPTITGSFTTGPADAIQGVLIPYTGNGYPISIRIEVDGGYASAAYYQYNALMVLCEKAHPEIAPTFSTGDANTAIATIISKQSSSSTNYNANYGLRYNTSNPTNGTTYTGTFLISSNTSIAIRVANGTSSSNRGFIPNTKYNYWVTYSE